MLATPWFGWGEDLTFQTDFVNYYWMVRLVPLHPFRDDLDIAIQLGKVGWLLSGVVRAL